MAKINAKAVFVIVIDGRMPDGSKATDDQVMGTLAICHREDEALAELFCIAKFGERLDGTKVDWDEHAQVLGTLEKLVRPPLERPRRPTLIAAAEKAYAAAESGTRESRRELGRRHLGDGPALHPPRHVRRTGFDVRVRLEEGAYDLGYAPAALLAAVAPGRPSKVASAVVTRSPHSSASSGGTARGSWTSKRRSDRDSRTSGCRNSHAAALSSPPDPPRREENAPKQGSPDLRRDDAGGLPHARESNPPAHP